MVRSVSLDVWKQRDLTRALDAVRNLALLLRSQSCCAAGKDLSTLGQEPLQLADIFVIYGLAFSERRALTTGHEFCLGLHLMSGPRKTFRSDGPAG